MKKRVLTLFGIVSCIVLIVLLSFFLNEKYTINFKKSDINNFLSTYKMPNDDIDIVKIVDEVIYGTHTDLEKNGDLFLTLGIFTFNTEKSDFNYYENTKDNRIVDFYITDDGRIYTVNVEYYNNYYKWNLMLNFDIDIASGIILDFFSYPTLLISNDDVYIAYINNLIDQNSIIQYFNVSKIENEELKPIVSLKGILDNNEGSFVNDISRVLLDNKNLVYVYESEEKQFLVKFDIDKNEEIVLYETEDDNSTIYSYLLHGDILYYQIIFDEQKNTSELNLVNSKSNKSLLGKTIYTFENYLNGNILMHNKDNSWKLYDISNNKITNISVEKDDFFPKYHILKENTIVAIDYKNEIYIGNLERK